MITRGATVIPPRGSTRLFVGDHLFVMLRPALRPFVDCAFSEAVEATRCDLPQQEVPLKGSTRVEDIWNSYGIELDDENSLTLEQLLKTRLGEQCEVGAVTTVSNTQLRVVEMSGSRITTVALSPLEETPADSNAPPNDGAP